METLLIALTLLRRQKLEGNFFDRNTSPEAITVMLVFGVLFIAGIMFGVKRSTETQWVKQKAVFSTDEVFDRLCEANHLNRDEIFFMRRMIFDTRCENPIVAFLNPEIIEGYMPQVAEKEKRSYLSMQQKLFGDLETAQVGPVTVHEE